jgi:hypothetical protein
MRSNRVLWGILALAVTWIAGATSAWAQSYVVQSATGQWATPPAGATTFSTIHVDDSPIGTISLPFPVPYWGTTYTTMYACSNGHVSFSSNQSTGNYSPLSLPVASGGTNDGIVMIAQRDLDGRYAPAQCQYWSDGSAPNRRFVISYSGWEVYSHLGANTLYFQAQFYESGKIVLAYTTNAAGAAWYSSSFGVGLDRPASSSYITPNGTAANYSFTGTPANDWVFFPPVTITGSVTWDRYVVNQNGIGATTEAGLPLAGIRIEQQDSAGGTLASTVTGATGAFTLTGVSSTSANIVVASQSNAGAVRRAKVGGTLYTFPLVTGGDFSANTSIGAFSLTESNDPGGAKRAPIAIAYQMEKVRTYAAARTNKSIPIVDPVVYDLTSGLATSYTGTAAVGASMTVASAASGNSDAWDASVVRKTYGRHVLAAISGPVSAGYDSTFDLATTEPNAFAEGFGFWINSIVSGDTKYYDGLNATTANVLDLEDPTQATSVPRLTVPQGPAVAGWAAAALYDLLDGVNLATEPWDTFDGAGAAGDQVFLTAASMTTAPTGATFFAAWVAKGYDGTKAARDLIRHGTLVDDPDEPNDSLSEAFVSPQFGLIRANRFLQVANPDWYRFHLDFATTKLTAAVIYDRVAYPSQSVLIELQSPSGAVLATGAPVGSAGPIELVSGALGVGDYLLRIQLNSGGPLPNYTLQAYSALAFSSGEFQPWTVGRKINVPVNVTGGIPPYTLTVLEPFVKPQGLDLSSKPGYVSGTPTLAGRFDFILSARDVAQPTPSTVSGPVTFIVNDEVKANFAEFVAFPFGKNVNRAAPYTGGTSPYVSTVDAGSLPRGLIASGGARIGFIGSPDAPGSYRFTMSGEDIAGSKATAEAVGVTCVPIGQAALGTGGAACGFYFDVVAGSTGTLAVSTVRGRTVRQLRGTLLDIDGATVLTNVRIKSGRGKTTMSGFRAAATGRYYFVVASDDAGDGTLLNCAAKLVADKSGAGTNGDHNLVAPNVVKIDVGVLAGGVVGFQAKPEKGTGLKLKAAYLLDPTGSIIRFADNEVREGADGSISFTHVMPTSGTWKVVVGAQPGPQGHFTYKYKVKEPKDVTYSVD